MKTLQFTIDDFASEAMTMDQMDFLKGGGDPIDLLIPPTGKKSDED